MALIAVPSPTLVGVGVGPGDPELITVKAVSALIAADLILVPSTEASGDAAGRAEQIVLAAVPQSEPKLLRVPFSMAQRSGIGAQRRRSWQASAEAATAAFAQGVTTVAFATVGDPSIYSTFSYLAAELLAAVPKLKVSVIPGITAMQAIAAATRTPLVEGRESLTLVSTTAGIDAVSSALDSADTVVAYKGGRQLAALLQVINEHGRDGVLGVNLGLPDQQLTPLSQVSAETAPYFSTVLIAPTRSKTGGSL